MKHRYLIKHFTAFMLLIFFINSLAAPDISSYFQEKAGCFILFDLNKNKMVIEYNPVNCEKRMPPYSTFKVPLSLMAFDQGLITQQTVFKWDGQKRWLPEWNQSQTPHTWLSNSVLWVSQEITPKLGKEKIQRYLKKFDYGNQDFSGDPGKNNALRQAWLGSSLKISPVEQLYFIKKLINSQLPISKAAQEETKANMELETSSQGWVLYGKTGSGNSEGWFIGFIQKSDQTYAFVLNFADSKRLANLEPAGLRAKKMVKDFLSQRGLF